MVSIHIYVSVRFSTVREYQNVYSIHNFHGAVKQLGMSRSLLTLFLSTQSQIFA